MVVAPLVKLQRIIVNYTKTWLFVGGGKGRGTEGDEHNVKSNGHAGWQHEYRRSTCHRQSGQDDPSSKIPCSSALVSCSLIQGRYPVLLRKNPNSIYSQFGQHTVDLKQIPVLNLLTALTPFVPNLGKMTLRGRCHVFCTCFQSGQDDPWCDRAVQVSILTSLTPDTNIMNKVTILHLILASWLLRGYEDSRRLSRQPYI